MASDRVAAKVPGLDCGGNPDVCAYVDCTCGNSDAVKPSAATRYDRSYLERTIATVRNHRDADNCWPSWANIFADEIERLWAENEKLREQVNSGRASCDSRYHRG